MATRSTRQSEIVGSVITRTVGALCAITLAAASVGAYAQDLEPRSYSNTPVGLNFLIAGYGYAEGIIAFDPSLPITDAQFHSNTEFVAYARSLGVWGKSAKFDVVVPYTSFSGHALVAGQERQRVMSGFYDPRFRFSINFFGAPALTLKEFAGYRQDVIIGASLQISAPVGEYDHSRALNLGNNRWSFKSELGISKAWGSWTMEIAPAVTFYTDNTDFTNGKTFSQDPIYSVQVHLIHSFKSGVWFALNGTYYTGGRTSVDGVQGNTLQTNTRVGLTLALPVNRSNSVKLHASTGASTRTGAEFDAIGVAWQYRWGAGF